MALTTIARGRVYSYSHYVGRISRSGPGFHMAVAITLGKNGVIYAVNREHEDPEGNPHVNKVLVGEPGAEELLAEFSGPGEEDGKLIWPTAIALDSQENVYVCDEWLQSISIFDQNGEFLKKWGVKGGGPGQFNGPSGLGFDREENLYVVDSRNHRVQKYTREGKFLGQWGRQGSGGGELNSPWGITIDQAGDIYVADWKNSRVQKFTPEGTLLKKFGRPGEFPDSLNHPAGVAVDPDGDVYVSDWGNDRVQIYTPDGDPITYLVGDAQALSKWAKQELDVNPDRVRARRLVKNMEPEWRFCKPTALIFDGPTNRLIVSDTFRGRLHIYIKDKNYKPVPLTL